MLYNYKPRGVCAQNLSFEIEDDKVKNVEFYGGCNGNLKGIACLIEDMPVDQVIKKLEGLHCGHKSTSCPDQLAKALLEAIEEKSK
ncbi:TIGR03905 family TSCPD domain-containing protein [Clostridium aminobutyricum]|uniref:ribonucleoside-diphosphate reductase n=1 Tax=Clostridium aminobutyricum TaxID=33953 RepID=A0A939D9N9_CLOAM|nr:TIGR03905 family TSCPD domain-containing protein [Clostridium aminobutyricum]MBN7773283.1 TIGR03905 family TSCPD domain-containing protein [Clostridium aminobutyricum]